MDRTQILQQLTARSDFDENEKEEVIGDHKTFQDIITLPLYQVPANPLDGCTHVFIDIGSNKGLQLRKLFQPQLFQRDPVLPIFQRWHRWCFVKFYGFTLLFLKDIFWCRYFGPPEKRLRDHICAVGFYPKEIIDQPEGPLIDLRNNYLTCGIKVILFLKIPAQLEYWYNFRCW